MADLGHPGTLDFCQEIKAVTLMNTRAVGHAVAQAIIRQITASVTFLPLLDEWEAQPTEASKRLLPCHLPHRVQNALVTERSRFGDDVCHCLPHILLMWNCQTCGRYMMHFCPASSARTGHAYKETTAQARCLKTEPGTSVVQRPSGLSGLPLVCWWCQYEHNELNTVQTEHPLSQPVPVKHKNHL